eukprot:jgi/Mesvir1/7059/Mv09175-RA.1
MTGSVCSGRLAYLVVIGFWSCCSYGGLANAAVIPSALIKPFTRPTASKSADASNKGTRATSAPPPRCPLGCELGGTCNWELGRCDCRRTRTGPDCSRLKSTGLPPCGAAAVHGATHPGGPCSGELPLDTCPASCNHRGVCNASRDASPARVTGGDNPAMMTPVGTCACEEGFEGDVCERFSGGRQALDCLNGCWGRGTCALSFCHCDPGYWGADCGQVAGPVGQHDRGAVGTGGKWQSFRGAKEGGKRGAGFGAGAGAGVSGGGMQYPVRVYVYELPPSLNGEGIDMKQLHDVSLAPGRGYKYSLDMRLHAAMLRSPHRVRDPQLADFFYVPVWDNMASWGTWQVFLQALAYIKATWGLWSGREHRHLWPMHRDMGGCDSPKEIERSIFITHWGGMTDMWQRRRKACFRPGLDIVVPPPLSQAPHPALLLASRGIHRSLSQALLERGFPTGGATHGHGSGQGVMEAHGVEPWEVGKGGRTGLGVMGADWTGLGGEQGAGGSQGGLAPAPQSAAVLGRDGPGINVSAMIWNALSSPDVASSLARLGAGRTWQLFFHGQVCLMLPTSRFATRLWDEKSSCGVDKDGSFSRGFMRQMRRRPTMLPVYSFGVRRMIWDRFRGKEGFHLLSATSVPMNAEDNRREMGAATFCLASSGVGWGIRAYEAILAGCIPVIIQDDGKNPPVRVAFEGDAVGGASATARPAHGPTLAGRRRGGGRELLTTQSQPAHDLVGNARITGMHRRLLASGREATSGNRGGQGRGGRSRPGAMATGVDGGGDSWHAEAWMDRETLDAAAVLEAGLEALVPWDQVGVRLLRSEIDQLPSRVLGMSREEVDAKRAAMALYWTRLVWRGAAAHFSESDWPGGDDGSEGWPDAFDMVMKTLALRLQEGRAQRRGLHLPKTGIMGLLGRRAIWR